MKMIRNKKKKLPIEKGLTLFSSNFDAFAIME